MNAALRSSVAHASRGNTSLRKVLDELIGRIEALEAGGAGSADPATAYWAQEGSERVIPVSKVSEQIPRKDDVRAMIAEALQENQEG